MSRVKNKKYELKSEKNEEQIGSQKTKKVKSLMSFDVYFSLLMKTRPEVMKHHKAPMRLFAEKNGLTNGTLEDFEKLFSSY